MQNQHNCFSWEKFIERDDYHRNALDVANRYEKFHIGWNHQSDTRTCVMINGEGLDTLY